MRLTDIAHPLRPHGGYALPHAVLLALLLTLSYLSGFGSGWFAHSAYDAHYFRQHYSHLGLRAESPTFHIERFHSTVGLAAQAQINTALYPGIGNQGTLGACAAWASGWMAAYEWRVAHPGSWWKPSPRYEYDYYSDTYTNGQDAGSNLAGDLALWSTSGLPGYKHLPEPPFQIDNPLPTLDIFGQPLSLSASQHIAPNFQEHVIAEPFAYGQMGVGQAGIDGLKAAISAGHPVFVGLGVYPEYDNATQQPLIVAPQPGETSRGGHGNVILAYDDFKVFPDGTVGGVLLQNQWTKAWGINGRAWLSYDFLRRFGLVLEYVTI